MDITFFGAARTVTGSCTLVECAGRRILVDCGLPQGNDEKKAGMDLPFNARQIDCVLLTHAHIDHTGRIPLLVKEGFSGRILCTQATCDLCGIMLADSGHIQEMEAEWQSRKRRRAGKSSLEPLYTVEDAHKAMELFEGYPYGRKIELYEGITIQFVDAGHLLGSSSIQMWLTEGDQTRLVVFSGDVGNLDQPLIKDPACLSDADFVVVESTYGDRLHTKPEHASQKITTDEHAKELADIINRTFSRGGNVIIPSFAVGRTQEILYLLRVTIQHGLVPGFSQIPVFLDSPLAIEATKVFSSNLEGYFDEEAMALVHAGVNPLVFPSLTLVVTSDESRELNLRKGSAVIISSSGMCEAGRIKHHLKHNLWRRESTVVFCGYQAEGTLGRSILDGAEKVTIFGEQIDVRAEICKLEGISGHADQAGLVRWLSCFGQRPRHIFVVHGEERVATWFAGFITTRLGVPAWAPEAMKSYDLLKGVLPVATASTLKIPGIHELDASFAELSLALSKLEDVAKWLRTQRKQIKPSKNGTDALRLAGAVSRLSNDIEALRSKWNGGSGDSHTA
ncbi:MAG: MBL fold metallo-hydrolase RNA specificity domain-containing protein [Sphaerochaetaceae bacterium]